mgnify:CR=1 FL=1
MDKKVNVVDVVDVKAKIKIKGVLKVRPLLSAHVAPIAPVVPLPNLNGTITITYGERRESLWNAEAWGYC